MQVLNGHFAPHPQLLSIGSCMTSLSAVLSNRVPTLKRNPLGQLVPISHKECEMREGDKWYSYSASGDRESFSFAATAPSGCIHIMPAREIQAKPRPRTQQVVFDQVYNFAEHYSFCYISLSLFAFTAFTMLVVFRCGWLLSAAYYYLSGGHRVSSREIP